VVNEIYQEEFRENNFLKILSVFPVSFFTNKSGKSPSVLLNLHFRNGREFFKFTPEQ